MEAKILNTKFEVIDIVDRFTSFIWTDRYRERGDFELVLPLDDYTLSKLSNIVLDYYVVNDNSEHAMIIEGYLASSSLNDGPALKVVGYSLETILSRRIIWDITTLSGNLQDRIEELINRSIIAPNLTERKIDNFVFERSTDPRITALTIDTKYEQHENLYDAIKDICEEKDIGFKIVLKLVNDEYKFVFSLYKGADRSYAQSENPYVIFSPSFENLSESSYLENQQDYKNVCYTTAEDMDTRIKGTDDYAMVSRVVGTATGLNRREVFTDAGSIESENAKNKLSDADKQNILEQKAKEALAESKRQLAMDGSVDPYAMYVYGRDFFMGDRVQIENEMGIKGHSSISEYIMSEDANGYTSYPTFTDFELEESA